MSTRGGGDSRCGEKGGEINAKKGRKKRETIFLEMSRKRENDKWIFGLDRNPPR